MWVDEVDVKIKVDDDSCFIEYPPYTGMCRYRISVSNTVQYTTYSIIRRMSVMFGQLVSEQAKYAKSYGSPVTYTVAEKSSFLRP